MTNIVHCCRKIYIAGGGYGATYETTIKEFDPFVFPHPIQTIAARLPIGRYKPSVIYDSNRRSAYIYGKGMLNHSFARFLGSTRWQ